jgi:hypothetical protein
MNLTTYALAKKLTEFPMENYIKNGDFSNNHTGWEAGNGTLSVADNTLYVTGNGNVASVTATQIIATLFEEGKKYYTKCKMRVTNSLCKRIAIVMHQLSDGSYYSVASQMSPENNILYDLSGIFEAKTDSQYRIRLNHLYNSATDADGAVMECQYVLAINLTDTFGAGNEPTKEEMDALLSCFPESWFDGRQNLPGKWVMKYLLNQVRDLKTAVAGLGGTL